MKTCKIIFLIALAILIAWSDAYAQYHYSRAEIEADWHRLAGNDAPYADTATFQHMPPRGYKPFYITHMGRHGSRYHMRASGYESFRTILRKADSMGVLTPTGRDILSGTEKVATIGTSHLGELLPLGRREHAGIIRRMYANFPEVFAPGPDGRCHVSAISTKVPRAVESMDAALEQLGQLVPCMDADICAGGDSSIVFCVTEHGKMKIYSDNVKKGLTDPSRVISLLFTDGGFLSPEEKDNLIPSFWSEAVGAWRADTLGVDLMKYLEPSEIYPLWRHSNAYYYKAYGESRGSYLDYTMFMDHLLYRADAAVAGHGNAADLHFAHDGNLLPFERLIGIEDCCTPVPEGLDEDENASDYYWNFAACTMGGNVQIIFFRKRHSGKKVLVKILMNEKEVSLKGLEPFEWPYYKWEDVRAYWADRLAMSDAVRDFPGLAPDDDAPLSEKIGICTGYRQAETVRKAGASYFEANVSDFLIPEEPEEKFEELLAGLQTCTLPVLAANGFFPGSFKIVGPEAETDRAVKYAETAIRRASRVGIRYLVLGSSMARTVPGDFDHAEAERQFVDLCKAMAPAAQRYGITVVIEPLRKEETNLINSVRDAVRMAKAVNHPNIAVLADFYHMAQAGEGPDAIVEAGALLKHCHVAEAELRTPPGVEGDDFSPYLKALETIGYNGRISIECPWEDFQSQAGPAVSELKRQIDAL